MLDRETVLAIRRMLSSGKYSQRDIARRMGIARGTVGKIALGRRRDRFEEPADDSPFEPGRPRRCPTCGGLVQMPCLACRVRQTNPEAVRDTRRRQSFDERQGFDGYRDCNTRLDPRGRRESRRRRRGPDDRQLVAAD